MRCGFVVSRAILLSPDAAVRAARLADDLGYHSAWVHEHLAVPRGFRSPYPFSSNGTAPFQPESAWWHATVVLAFLAGVTEHLRLGSSVITLFTRDPMSLAKEIATLDLLSGGRVELGLGAGWLTEEANVLGHPTDHRMERLSEAIDILKRSWSNASFSYEGRFYQIPDIGLPPLPPQGAELPILLGGHSQASIRLAAQKAAGIVASSPNPELLQGLAADLRRQKPSARVAASVSMGEPKVWRERVEAIRDAGADLAILSFPSGPQEIEDDLRRFAETVGVSI